MNKLFLIGALSLTLMACERREPLSQDEKNRMERQEEDLRMETSTPDEDLADANDGIYNQSQRTTSNPSTIRTNRTTSTSTNRTIRNPAYRTANPSVNPNYNRNPGNTSTINYTPYESSRTRNNTQDTSRSSLDTRARSGVYDPMNPNN